MGQRLVDELLSAISWIEPPFVDDKTSLEEIRQRIAFVIADKDRALEYAHKRGERVQEQNQEASTLATAAPSD